MDGARLSQPTDPTGAIAGGRQTKSKVWMVHSCPFRQDESTGQDQKSKWMGYRYSNPHDPTGANHQDEVTGQGIKPDPAGEDEALKDAKPK